MNESEKEPILKIFNEEFNKFSIESFNILEQKKDFKKDNQLYHYTSFYSLQKIIEKESLWATSIFMLNDPNELFFGRDQIIDWYLTCDKKKKLILDREHAHSIFPAFVFCLTELNDDMHFWDKYGDKHKGLRIGFTPKNFVEYWRKLNRVNVVLAPVVYQDYGKKYVGDYAEVFISLKENLTTRINEQINIRDISYTELNDLNFINSIIASFIKRKEWGQEKEWRIICIPQGFLHNSIIGDFNTGAPMVRLENKARETLAFLTNMGHDGAASKDVLRVGALAGNLEYIRYTIQLLMKIQTGGNFFNDNISKSTISVR